MQQLSSFISSHSLTLAKHDSNIACLFCIHSLLTGSLHIKHSTNDLVLLITVVGVDPSSALADSLCVSQVARKALFKAEDFGEEQEIANRALTWTRAKAEETEAGNRAKAAAEEAERGHAVQREAAEVAELAVVQVASATAIHEELVPIVALSSSVVSGTPLTPLPQMLREEVCRTVHH